MTSYSSLNSSKEFENKMKFTEGMFHIQDLQDVSQPKISLENNIELVEFKNTFSKENNSQNNFEGFKKIKRSLSFESQNNLNFLYTRKNNKDNSMNDQNALEIESIQDNIIIEDDEIENLLESGVIVPLKETRCIKVQQTEYNSIPDFN